jgi:hypothetical protein
MTRGLVAVVATCLALGACEGDKKAPPAGGSGGAAAAAGGAFEQKNTPDNLKGVVEALLRALAKHDEAAFTSLLGGLQPDEATVKKALRDGVPADAIARVLATARQMPTLGPSFTTAEVHGATGSEIKEQSTPETGHFSGNDRDAASDLLRPDMTYYNVIITGGGDEKTLHLFFWDGSGWKMLGHIEHP